MGKTKTQAEKLREREARIQEREIAKNACREAHVLEIQKKLEEQPKVETELKILSKKELRKQKKKLTQEECQESSMPKETDSLINSTLVEQSFISSPIIENVNSKLERLIDTATEKAKQDATEERLNTSKMTAPARLVQNHSSYCEGLKPVLTRLRKTLSGCTLLPQEISRGKDHCEEFELRFQRMVDKNTYKFVARYGSTSQDVTISVPDAEFFTKELLCEGIEDAIISKSQQVQNQEGTSDNDIRFSTYNRVRESERQSFWRMEHQQDYLKVKKREDEIKRQQEITEHTRKLASKGVDSAAIEQYAERDIDIISGKNRGKCSMK